MVAVVKFVGLLVVEMIGLEGLVAFPVTWFTSYLILLATLLPLLGFFNNFSDLDFSINNLFFSINFCSNP